MIDATWPGLDRGRPCSIATAIYLIAYLETTSVKQLAGMLRTSALSAWHAEIRGREMLGNASSIFGNLGGLNAKALLQRPKFLVRDVSPILHRPDCEAEPDRKVLDELIGAARGGTLHDRRITFALTSVGPMIVDGNKRAVAIYETAQQGAAFILPVYVLEPKPGVVLTY